MQTLVGNKEKQENNFHKVGITVTFREKKEV